MTGHIFIEGDIGSDVTSKSVREDIANYPKATNFIVHINSGGGDVYEGYQIGSILKNLGKPTVAHIGAVCASIATYAACSCDSVVMSPHGVFMIHLPTGNGISGNADDLRKAAGQLDRIKSEIIDRYLPRVSGKGITREQLSAMMEKETSMSPGEAESMGFVDTVQEKLRAVARMDATKFNDMTAALTKEEAKGMFDSFAASLAKMFAPKAHFKNQVSLTLEDGTEVMVMTETVEDIVGKQVQKADGSALPPGQHNTQDGQTLTVDANSTITEAIPMANQNDEVAKLKEENAALKQQLEASATASQEAVQKEVAKVTNAMQAQFKNLSKQFEDLKTKTFGEEGGAVTEEDNKKQTSFKNKEDRPHDPMAASLWPVVQSRYNTYEA